MAERGQPICQRGFFEPRLGVEAWGDPIAGGGHIAADCGITGFVGPQEADSAQVQNIQQQQGDDEPATRQVFSIMKRRARNILKAGASEGLRMKIVASFLLASFALLGQAQNTGKSALDKPTLEAYLRYAELWIPQVT